MRVNIQNAYIYLTKLRNAQSFDHSECSNKKNTFVSKKKGFDEGQYTKCIYLHYYTQKCPKL